MAKSAIEQMKDVMKVQESSGNWDYDRYMHGMYNGMELMLSIAENREPIYRDAPKEWLAEHENMLTDPITAQSNDILN